ncbi:unnamed protein product [Eruca vesicaria subsp. sativa]|uniref:non-specific serine/threonine protein kinase n=1 Tax=Eruca vesicaria subsp. sativa TaxID=29727 RepID=A0ABC8KXF0_ERUVS|nr:unnamed protein product [Eruca vesicaria subsp. sativa]
MINLNISKTKSMFYIIICMLFAIPSCVFSTNELHDRCSQPFRCGDQSGLLYPFWTSGREDCGHPEFKLNCSGGFAELSISSVKFRILEANYNSRFIRLARSDFIGGLCPKDPSNAPFDQKVLPLVPTTELLTIYYDCRQDFSQYVSTYVGELACDNDDDYDDERINYYVTRNLSSPLFEGISSFLNDFRVYCDRNVSIPASGPALNRLQLNSSTDNLKKTLEQGFVLGLNQDCSTCTDVMGACGYNKSSSGFICYNIEEANNRTRKKVFCIQIELTFFFLVTFHGEDLSTGAIAGLIAGVILFLFLVLALFLQLIRKRNKKAFISQPKLKALIPLKQYSYSQVKKITKSFAEVVGRGGFGTVYRGTLSDGRSVAVKVLKDAKGYSGEDFINEVASISQTSHINIVTLLGFCYEDTRGTIGYIAPELFSRMYGRVSHKSDVYSYGMLVLEMIGARNKQEVGPSTSSMYFPEWIYKDLEIRGSGSHMENGVSSEEEEMVRKMTLVGLWCIQSSPSDRPPMNRVVEMMEGSVDALEVPPRPVFQIPAEPLQESSTLSENISGGNCPKSCGHPSLKLHCFKNTTSLIISDHLYEVLHIDEASNTLRLARADLRDSFCNGTFTDATLPTEIFELSPMYKSLTVFHHCNSKLPYRSSYTCPGNKGPISVSQTIDYHNSCTECFTINVPKSFVPEEKELNMTKFQSVLSKGFEVKIMSFTHAALPPFSCGNQSGLLYPFWIPGREECGHPDFKLDCHSSVAEINICSVKYRILAANYTSRVIRLARSDYSGGLCPQHPINGPFSQNVLPFAPDTDMLTIYNECPSDFPKYVSSYVGDLDCDVNEKSYYVTTNLSSPLKDLGGMCKRNVSIPASGPALDTLQKDTSRDNLKKALEEGFKVGLHKECLMCMDSGGACGYKHGSKSFLCYCVDHPHGRTCRNKGMEYAFGLVAIILIAGGLYCVISRRRKTLDVPSQLNLKALIPLKHYSYAQVKRITKSFAIVVGKGGFGTVYRGTLCDGRSVAVKVLKDTKGNGEDFINEVASMSKTSHVNIVTLLGFCAEGTKRAILYEFLENGSLDNFISSTKSSNKDWMMLYGIALGIARGLEYLHHGCRTRIVHFDIKPQNVLLDHNLCPKMSDFGLAKLCGRKESMLSLLDTRGTIGYIAPEVFSRVYGKVSHKSDVYSYGMLVLEMIGARAEPSTEDNASTTSSVYFPEWIYTDLAEGDSGRPRGNGITFEEEEIAKKMTLVGLWCIQSSPSDRPSMNRVVEMMEGSLDDLEVPPKPVLQAPLPESSTLSEDISVSTEICSMNIV